MTAKRETITEDGTPFLKNEIIGHELWIVDIPKWSVKMPSPSTVKDRYSRKLKLYIVPETGVVVKVKSDWPAGVPAMPPVVSADIAETQLGWIGEKYHGFPDHAPRVTFQMALDAMAERGYGATGAKQIVADCVIWSQRERPPRAVWAVMLRGLGVIKPPPGTPREAMDQYRHLIDAETGEWLFFVNFPRFESDPEKVKISD